MQIELIDLNLLRPHPLNSNVMAEPLLAKLAGHIARSDRYPPVVVRPLKEDSGANYQILDGHHRIEALRRLGRPRARCVVWDVDDDEAMLLLATLNRLQGRDDPHKRAALLADLSEAFDPSALVTLLPEDRAALDALLTLNDPPPTPRPPRDLADLPVAVHFFLKPHEKRTLDARLKAIGGTREQAIMQLVQHPEES
jgi:ParB family transcriptional regulator, chromosome partitioning protein